MMNKNDIELIILAKTEQYLLKVKQDITISELKSQINRKTGVNIDLVHLYYNNTDLISYYDNQSLTKLLLNNTSNREHILFMINTEGTVTLLKIRLQANYG